MKNIYATVLLLAGFSLAACGTPSEDDLKDAIRTGNRERSGLNYKVGEKYKEKRVVVKRGDVGGSLTGSDVQYKYENGEAKPCAHAAASNSTTDCGVFRSVVRTETTTLDGEVTRKADLAWSSLPGFIIQETAQTTVDEQWYWPVAGTNSTGNVPSSSSGSLLRSVGERNGFVVAIEEGGEGDVGNSATLFPSSPRSGRTYTDDRGMSWTVTDAVRATVGSYTVSAAAMTVATDRNVRSLEEIKKRCVFREGQTATTFRVSVVPECKGTLQLVYEHKLEVGLDLVLREHLKTVEMQIVDAGVRDPSGAFLTSNITTGNNGDFVIFYTTVETEETRELTDLTF